VEKSAFAGIPINYLLPQNVAEQIVGNFWLGVVKGSPQHRLPVMLKREEAVSQLLTAAQTDDGEDG
jgi:hypothetical protein